MKLLKLACILSLFISFHASAQNDRKDRIKSYIEQYKQIAMREQKRVGIPAAVTLAQGIHETNAGASELAVNANNHFGIKCKKEWKGDTYTYTDDRPDECFRKYGSDLESYKDHSDYLKNSKRYESLFGLSMTDYAGWAYGLKRCGYATNPKYAQILIRTIEEYRLQEFTYAALDKGYDPVKEAEKPVKMGQEKYVAEVVPEKDAAEQAAPSPQAARPTKMVVNDGTTQYDVVKKSDKPVYGKKVIVNGLKAFYAPKGRTLLNDAMELNMRYAKLLEINDLPDAPLEADMYIYLERKNNKGSTTYHVVKPGETMIQIAQYEGLALKDLRKYNKMRDNEEPVGGSLLQLQEIAERKPDVIVLKKEKENDEFAGSETQAVPQGTTRMKSGYISKEEIEKNKEVDITRRKVEDKETNAVKTEVTITQPTEVTIAEEAIGSDKKVVVVEEETTTITPDKDVIVEKVTTTQSIEKENAPVVVEKEKTVINEGEDVIVEKNTTVVAAADANNAPQEVINIADTKSIEEEKAESKKEEPKPEEPMDEFARLKARLDKAVYASEHAKKTVENNSTPASEKTEPEEPKKAPKAAVPAGKPGYYTVKKGDTAFAIAKKHNITMTQLKEWNSLDFNEIKVGQKLRVK